MTRILGAILAGGQSRRFGSDKARAALHGIPLIEHVMRALRPQCDAIVICGRPVADVDFLIDRPGPGLGPLGGLAAALHAGRQRRFDMVVTAPCDAPELPADLVAMLWPGPAFVADMPVIGLWPTALSAALDVHIASDPRRSMRGWARRADAIPRALPRPVANVNTPADLQALANVD